MVGEQRPGVDSQTVPSFDLPQQLGKLHRLFRIGEHILTTGEPVVHVVQPTFNQHPSPTRHLQNPLPRTSHNFVNFVSPGTDVIRFDDEHDVPILMGEFGMQFEQRGGVQFLSDLVDIATSRGWHFCLWNFRSDTLDPTFLDFDYERWDPAYRIEILSWWATSTEG